MCFDIQFLTYHFSEFADVINLAGQLVIGRKYS